MLTGEPVFFDESVCVSVGIHRAGRTGDNGHTDLHCFKSNSQR